MIQYDPFAMLPTIGERLREIAGAEDTEYQRTQLRAAAEILANAANRLRATLDDVYPPLLRRDFVDAVAASSAPAELKGRAERCLAGTPIIGTGRGECGAILADAIAWARRAGDARVHRAGIALADAELDFEISALTR